MSISGLQASGTITLAQIQVEFGGSNPAGINEYYRDGDYSDFDGTGVPNLAANSGIPTSGAIDLADFYSKYGAVTVTISSNQINFNLRNTLTALGWNTSNPVAAHLVINSGVTVSATATSTAALTCYLNSSSILSIHNSGTIVGKGGAAGSGGAAASGGPGSAGGAGGHAIDLQSIAGVVVRNYGNIHGGGGGGGGGGGARGHGSAVDSENDCTGGSNGVGGAGGVGAGTGQASGAGGSSGSVAGGSGGSGGNYGAAGSPGGGGGASGCSVTNGSGGAGGTPGGKAIRHVSGIGAQTIAVTGTINGATS